MPCKSDYLEANAYEKEISRVYCLLAELNGEKYPSQWWDGYHPNVYNRISKEEGDALVSELCTKLQKIDVSQCSLEMQIWWRDHQEADKKRVAKELEEAELNKQREAVMSKLTDYELKLLGVKK